MPLKFAIAGSSGMIGSAVCEWLTQRGHSVTRLIRPSTFRSKPSDSITWDPYRKTIDLEKLEGHDAVINFAGASISDQRWTSQYKKIIHDSRIESTSFLSESLRKLKRPPKNFFSTSAIGFYGDHPPEDIIEEGGANGHGFLAGVTREWELATKQAELVGINVTHMRMGVVLDTRGGALAKMLPPFYLGLGGPIGSGKQIMSWIALWEIPQMIYFLAIKGGVKGPVNFTAPEPVSNREFAKVLGSVLNRPAFLPLPNSAVTLIFGEMGKELLLNGAHVAPRRLLDKGYNFAYPNLRSALTSILK
ncbi:MAG: TIGR01777 family protein [Candidatus Omnitrophica bacterium]|nr:TIGR01777 family protein [Candidatus Omnitrophota bacterium]